MFFLGHVEARQIPETLIMTTTTALLVKEVNGPFSLGEVFLDTIRNDEALVEIQATGVCHTDVAVANGTLPGSAPAVLGHEGEICPDRAIPNPQRPMLTNMQGPAS